MTEHYTNGAIEAKSEDSQILLGRSPRNEDHWSLDCSEKELQKSMNSDFLTLFVGGVGVAGVPAGVIILTLWFILKKDLLKAFGWFFVSVIAGGLFGYYGAGLTLLFTLWLLRKTDWRSFFNPKK